MQPYKKVLLRILTILLIVMLFGTAAAAANYYRHGDVNGDSVINLKDVTALRRALAAGDVALPAAEGNPDVNSDGTVNLKDVTLLQRHLAGGWGVELPDDPSPTEPPQPEPDPEPGVEWDADLAQYEVLTLETFSGGVSAVSFRYGQSVNSRDLVCWSIHQESYDRTILLNFEIHGWEDSYAADGQLLVDLGNALVAHYSQSADLQGTRLLIIPSANPDGLADGVTNDGFGRCNADGIDLNRDFDANYTPNPDPRYYTPYAFSAPESRALRDLVLASKPDIVLDFHGWLNYTIGSSELAEVFSTCVGLNHKNELAASASGYFSYWAQLQGAEAMLVEFQDPPAIDTDAVIRAIDRLIADNYGSHQYDYELSERYADFASVTTHALTSDRVYTQRQVGDTGTSYGYIDGSTDRCTIAQIYSNGWCKVNYPVGNLTKTGYCETSAFIDPQTEVAPYTAQVSSDTKVYTTTAMTAQIGSVWDTDVFTVIAEKDGLAQIIYPLDEGGFKMGWIDAGSILQN